MPKHTKHRKDRHRRLISVKATRKRLERLLNIGLNVHHIYYPGTAYDNDPLAKLYRELPCQRMITPIDDHTELHRNKPISPIPSQEEMRRAIEQCQSTGCDKHSCAKPIQLGYKSTPIDPSLLPPEVRLVCLHY